MRHKYPSFAAASGQSLRSSPRSAMSCRRPAHRLRYARDEHEYFRGIAEAVVPRRQPTSDVVGNMIKKDPPQCDASAGIYSQVAAPVFQLQQLVDQWLGGSALIVHPVAPTS